MATLQGEKKRIRKQIARVIKKVEDHLMSGDILPYFEPFCGNCSVLRHFLGQNDRKVYASDIDPDLIFIWKIIQATRIPPCKCSAEEYLQPEKNNPAPNDSCSLASIGQRLVTISDTIQDVIFEGPGSYDEYDPKGMLIYCDPSPRINSSDESFWKTMRKWNEDNIVIIAKQSAPDDFVIIWECNAHSDRLYIHQKLSSLVSLNLKNEIKTY